MDAKVTTKECGSVLTPSFYSPALGIEKRYKIYLPPGYDHEQQRYPVLYLFRGHENEWFDPYQDHSRGGEAIQNLMDELIGDGIIGKLIVVGVGMTSDNGQVYGLGINFLNPRLAGRQGGIGSGQFEDYFVNDLIPHIDHHYRTIPQRACRGADGFSLGGYTAVMLAIKHPQLFCSVGSYDGSHMFRDLDDPRLAYDRHDDLLWVRNDNLFAPAFRRPRQRRYDVAYMMSYSAVNLLEKISPADRRLLEKTDFFIQSAAFDGLQGNRDRAVHLVTLLHLHGIPNRAGRLILSNDAHHTWKFADLHMRETLPRHSRSFGISPAARLSSRNGRQAPLKVRPLEEARPIPQEVHISYHLPEKTVVRLEIVNSHGETVAPLYQGVRNSGSHTLVWSGKTAEGHWVGSGVYFVQMSSPGGCLREKFVFLR